MESTNANPTPNVERIDSIDPLDKSQSLGEFAMPFLGTDVNDPLLVRGDSPSESSHRKYNEAKTDGNDSIMHSYSKDSLPKSLASSEETGSSGMKKQMTPLNLQSYSISPENKYISLRGYSASSSDEKISPFPNKEDIVEIPYDELMDDEQNTFSYGNFLKKHRCYDIIPNSSKIVVFDTRLKVKKAFFALVHNSIRSAPLWDSSQQEFIGMLTITDFINILIRYYKSPLEKMWELEEHQIETWRNLCKKNVPSTLLRISPTECLYDGLQFLMKNKIHRLPVIDADTGNAMYILTHKKILFYIYQHLDDLPMPDFLGRSLQDLGIGSYTDIATVKPTTTVIEALRIFSERGVSALPIVDESNKCVDIYSKCDVINLAAERTYNNLDVTVHEALEHRQVGFEGVVKCSITETLYTIIDRLACAKVHRLVVVDKDDSILGIVSLSDILRFLVDPPKSAQSGI